MLVCGILMVRWRLAESLPVALVLIGVASVADGPGLAATFAVRQDWAPRDLQGQIFTTAAGLKVGAFALGAAVAGPLVTGIGSGGAIIAPAGPDLVGVAVGRPPAPRAEGR